MVNTVLKKTLTILMLPGHSSPEEGELSSSGGSSNLSSDEFDESELRKEFDDGYDSELVGDEEDRRNLENMTEKEREQELYNRYSSSTISVYYVC